MRVLFWSELFWPYLGGVEVLSMDLIPRLQARGHEVVVVTSHDNVALPDEEEFSGIPIRRFPFRAALSAGDVEQVFRLQRQVARFKQAWQPDLVHVNSVGPSALFHLATNSAWKSPVLVTMQQNILPHEDTGPTSLVGRSLRESQWVSCVSRELLEQVRERVPETGTRSSTIYNVVELPSEQPAPLPFDQPRLICLGRLVPQKGFDIALRAWAMICDRFPQARLVIAGDGESRGELETLAADLGLRDKVDFLGWIAPPQVPALLNTATIVLMPSRREGMPLVGVQAATMGRPIIGSDATGLPEIVEHGKTGLLIGKDNCAALAEAIVSLLSQPERAREQGRAARRRALKLFDWEQTVSAYCDLYQRLNEEFAHGRAHLCAS